MKRKLFATFLATALCAGLIESVPRANAFAKKMMNLIGNGRSSPGFSPLPTSCANAVRINVFGDVYMIKEKVKLSPALFAYMKPALDWADFNIANFEGAVTSSNERAFPDFPFALKMSSEVPSLLSSVGIRYVTRANNHAMDFGAEGLFDTNEALEQAGITWAGVGRNMSEAYEAMYFTKNDVRFAVVSLNMTYPKGAWANDSTPGVAYPVIDRLRPALAEAKAKSDYLFVIFHWGEELTARPRSYQPEMASFVIKNGADAVFGAHTHMAQGIEEIESKPVAYGLGNFMFTAYSEGANFSLSAHVEACYDKQTSQKTLRVAYMPLDTLNRRTGFYTRPMQKNEFKKMVAPYIANKLMAPSTLFYLPDVNETHPLSEWKTLLKIATK